MDKRKLKAQVRAYWNIMPCATQTSGATRYSRRYFDETEAYRYRAEPMIPAFAGFRSSFGRKILEVGTGVGTDFIQWVRAGAKAHGIDISEKSVEITKKRLQFYGLSAESLRAADAENLPYPDNAFDIVYSWGTIHHTPDPDIALKEIIRVACIGGIIKIMVYNRRSLYAFYKYLYYALLRGKPFRRISWIFYNYQESLGTRAFSIKEIRSILAKYPVRVKHIQANITRCDLWERPFLFRILSRFLAHLLGPGRVGFYITVELEKTADLEIAMAIR